MTYDITHLEANKEESLALSDGHHLTYAEYGNPTGEPVIILHGGPGVGMQKKDARYFDPAHYRIIMYNQRGCNPDDEGMPNEALLKNNNTDTLVQDIETLRSALRIESQDIHLFGGSWGATLGLSYAIAHPEHVKSLTTYAPCIGGVDDLNHLYGGGAFLKARDEYQSEWTTEEWNRLETCWRNFVAGVPEHLRPEAGRIADGQAVIAYYAEQLQSDDLQIRNDAIERMGHWEGALIDSPPQQWRIDVIGNPEHAGPFTVLASHFAAHHFFVADTKEDSNKIIDGIAKLKHKPIDLSIVHGKNDMVCDIQQSREIKNAMAQHELDTFEYHEIEGAGHSSSDKNMENALTDIMDRLVQKDRRRNEKEPIGPATDAKIDGRIDDKSDSISIL